MAISFMKGVWEPDPAANVLHTQELLLFTELIYKYEGKIFRFHLNFTCTYLFNQNFITATYQPQDDQVVEKKPFIGDPV